MQLNLQHLHGRDLSLNLTSESAASVGDHQGHVALDHRVQGQWTTDILYGERSAKSREDTRGQRLWLGSLVDNNCEFINNNWQYIKMAIGSLVNNNCQFISNNCQFINNNCQFINNYNLAIPIDNTIIKNEFKCNW